MLTARVVLIDRTKKVSFEQLSAVAAALNLQVQRDLAPIWQISAAVTASPNSTHVSLGTWPIFIVDNLPPDEGGVHLTRHHQPYALVELGAGWTIAASHECLEMLVDPSGSRLHASNAVGVVDGRVQDVPGKFEYLVEVCDPSESDAFAYAIDDVTVSDFYTPRYFDPVGMPNARYSFTGAIKKPRDVLNGGYLSWLNPETNTLQQLKNFGSPEIVDLGEATGACLRQFVDGKSRTTVGLSKLTGKNQRLSMTTLRGTLLDHAAAAKAKAYER